MLEQSSLAALGWRPYFQQQLKLEELDDCIPARIVEQHKSLITVATESSLINVELQSSMPTMVVGDWILRVMRGGPELSAITLARFFGVHVWVLPAALLLILGIHMYLVIKIGISAVPKREEKS